MHSNCVCLQPGVNGLAAKPVPPPRDHLRLEQDGRLVNRAPAPQVPARTTAVAATPIGHNNNADPTKEQLESIRKFQVSVSRPGLWLCSCTINNNILYEPHLSDYQLCRLVLWFSIHASLVMFGTLMPALLCPNHPTVYWKTSYWYYSCRYFVHIRYLWHRFVNM